MSINEKYIDLVFSVIKKKENILISDKKTNFNETELRLIREIISAQKDGKRLISTQLAVRLGVTRSAVSQIVNRLVKEGVVERIPDDVNRKISYVELTEKTMEDYDKDLQVCGEFIHKAVQAFGEEKFDLLCSLLEEFSSVAEEQKEKPKKRPYKKRI